MTCSVHVQLVWILVYSRWHVSFSSRQFESFRMDIELRRVYVGGYSTIEAADVDCVISCLDCRNDNFFIPRFETVFLLLTAGF